MLSIDIPIWLILWFGTFSISSFVLYKKKIDYLRNYKVMSVYFLASTLCISVIFWDRIWSMLKSEFPINLILLLVLIIIVPFVGLILYKILKEKREKVLSQENIRMQRAEDLRLDYRFLISKSADIIFQQTMMIALLSIFVSLGFGFSGTILYFGLFFAIIHLPLLFFLDSLARVYIFTSFLVGFIFSFFILGFKLGILFTYGLHWFLYFAFAILFWLSLGFRKFVLRKRL